MSVDYIAEYGIGYKVDAREGLTREQLKEGFEEYLSEAAGVRFGVFAVGSAYDDDDDEVFLVCKSPFKYGLDLSKAKADLDSEIVRLELDTENEFGLVGGLYVW